MDFSDPGHDVSDVTFQGAGERDPTDGCDAEVLEALTAWSARPRQSDPAPEPFAIEAAQYFTISYDGKADRYWPDAESNWLSESLVRDFLFHDGICLIENFTPQLYSVKYKVQAISGTEHLLVCPYATDAGNIGGIVVVCVNHHLREAGDRQDQET